MKLKKRYFKSLRNFSVALLTLVASLFVNSLASQTIDVSLLDGPAAEEGLTTATFRITTSLLSFGPITINYALTGPAVEGEDYEVIGNVIIPAVNRFVDVNIIPIEDTIIEGNTDVIFTILPSVDYTVGANDEATTFIEENDIGVVTLLTIASEAQEEGPVNGRFQIRLSGVNNTGLSLIVAGEFSGDATPPGLGGDFTTTGNGTFNATQLAKNINIIPVDDTIVENLETVTYTLTSTGNPWYQLAPAAQITGDVTIEDNDCTAGDDAPVLNTATLTERCDVASVNLNTFVAGAAASAPPGSALRWSLIPNPTATSDLVPTTATISDTYYGVYFDTVNSCASPSLEVVLTLNTSPSAGTTTNASACNNADNAFMPRVIDLDDLISDEDAGDWTQTGGTSVGNIPNNNRISFDNRPAEVYEFTYTTTDAVAPCVNSSSTVTITVTNCDPCTAGSVAPVLNSSETVFCGPIPASVELTDFAPNTGPNNNPLKWSSTETDPISNIVANAVVLNPPPGTYYGFYHDETNDCASPVVPLTLISRPVPDVSSANGAERCGLGVVNLTASVTLNATINWYATINSTAVLSSGANFSPNVSQTTTFFVEATLNGCDSERVAVVATVVPQPSAGVPQNGGIASACSVAANGPTIIDLDDLILGEDAGAWVFTSGPNGENISIPPNAIINFENRADGDYVFTYTTTGAQAPCTNESSMVTISVNDCDVDSDLDGLFDGPEAVLGTNPNNPDSDGDGLNDSEEVGPNIDNPLDEDEDGIIDALESNTIDTDMDGVVDQLDPANENPCIPVRQNGVCDFDGDGILDSDEIANGSDPDDPCDPDAENSACNAEVDLEVLKEVDNFNALVGETVVFTITVNNISMNTATSIVIGDLLETGFEFVSHSPAAEQYDPETGQWAIPSITAGASATLEITVNILETGVYSNTAELLDVFQTDINPDNDISEPITLPIMLPEGIDLVIEKTALSPNPLVNDEVIFTIKVINESIDELPVTNIEVEDIIGADSGFEFIDSNTLTGVYDNATGVWSIESLDRNQEAILEIRVLVPNEGRFTNTARIVRSSPSDGNLDNNEATVEVIVSIPTVADVGFLFNQFSPNGDGTNDVLKINIVDSETNLEAPIIYNIQIFNRYGNRVLEANNRTDNEVWDGTYKGKDAPSGTYFYTMSIDVGNGPEPKKGWIQLIR